LNTILTEDKAYKICVKYEIPIPEYHLIQNLEEALRSAAQIGYPAVAKIVSPSIYHKAAVGGVKLGIKTEHELSEAYHSLIQVARREGIKDAKIMIQKQAPPGLEVMIGATTDPQFGKVVMLGSGGVYARRMSRTLESNGIPVYET
jgi:acyl-CoA synthetase (NDP forming)